MMKKIQLLFFLLHKKEDVAWKYAVMGEITYNLIPPIFLSRQHLIQLINNRPHPLPKKLPHFASA
ncbi:MAG: hypothetical protein ACOYOE_13595, partial [Chlorobium sp.]